MFNHFREDKDLERLSMDNHRHDLILKREKNLFCTACYGERRGSDVVRNQNTRKEDQLQSDVFSELIKLGKTCLKIEEMFNESLMSHEVKKQFKFTAKFYCR